MNNNKEMMINIICCVLVVILIVVLIICMVRNDNFASEHENNDKAINVIVGRPSCPFCVRQYKFLNDNHIKHTTIDSSSKKGQELMEKLNANGVPLAIVMKNDKIVRHNIGYNENLDFYE